MSLIKNSSTFSDVPIRIRSWGVIVLILIVALITPELTYVGVAALSYGCMREYFFITKSTSWAVQSVSYSVIGAQLVLSFMDCYVYFAIVAAGVAIIAGLILRKQTVFNAILLFSLFIGTMAFIRNIDIVAHPMAGLKLLILLIVLTEFNDIFQYLSGKFFGRHKIAPRLSPNKTVEGFIGGVLLTTLLANGLGLWLMPAVEHLTLSMFGIVISTLGFAGDLYISSLKRKLNIKDTGTLIPGHGGLLDRVDSLIFITPIYYLIIINL